MDSLNYFEFEWNNAHSVTHKRRARQSSRTIQSVQYSISCIHDIKNKCI